MGAIRIGTVIAGKYRLESPLAQGGMGSVWVARHLLLDKTLAIKFIGAEVAGLDEVRTRFAREAMAAASLQSPHVVQIHDYGIDDDVPYLVMELLEGEDLGDRLARRGRLSAAETSSLVSQVARALRRAAGTGIVHRDLKPSNIFILRGDDDDEIVKVLDFGVAKAPHLHFDETTQSGAMIGSPRYMSPEQARGSRLVDHRSDLWSLAVIAYRALTGQLPFVGDDIADLIVKICTETAPPPSQVEPSLGPDVDAFFAQALARAADDRFQTARELAIAFANATGEAPPMSVSSSQLPAPTMPSRQSAPSLPVAAMSVARYVAPIELTRRSVQLGPPIEGPASVRGAALREGVTTAEPFAHRRAGAVLQEGTLTSSVGSIDLPAQDVARLARLARRVRLTRAAVLVLVMVTALGAARTVWSPARSEPSPVVVERPVAAVAPAAAVPASPGSAPPPEDVATVLAVPGSASASSSPRAVPPRLAPRPLRPTKRHSVLGI